LAVLALAVLSAVTASPERRDLRQEALGLAEGVDYSTVWLRDPPGDGSTAGVEEDELPILPHASEVHIATYPGSWASMLALTSGILSIEHGCLFIGDSLLVLPEDRATVFEGALFVIRGVDGRVTRHTLGEAIQVGGGHGDIARYREYVSAGQVGPAPEECLQSADSVWYGSI